ncbi:MAG: PQQ-binding-like beta-propeller repeat protein [Dermatophilaceae bacterium]|nr:PQQ-binding-like beta-propeller repeat protein [Dermatophilaceae bacterium]
MRRTRRGTLVSAVLFGLVLSGCAKGGKPASDESSGPAITDSALRTPVSVSGPWRAWTASVSAQEVAGTCAATAHQVVCGTGSGGIVGRSRATGAVTWTAPAPGKGRSGNLVVDAADERAVTGVGRVLRTANLRTGKAAWTHRLAEDRAYFGIHAASGTVYALDASSRTPGDVALTAFRASDGRTLWHHAVAADPTAGIAAFGGRVYVTDGTRVTARSAASGAALATSPQGTECPELLSGGRYLVCTGSPLSAGDVFPRVRRLDPGTLEPLPTARDSGQLPARGLISADGVLMLFETSAEDPGAGDWNAYDLVHGRKLWSYSTSTWEGALADGRFVTFTPEYDQAKRGRLISIDLHAGPQGTGTAAPRMSAAYSQTRGGEHPVVLAPGEGTGHVVVMARTHGSLRSLPLP